MCCAVAVLSRLPLSSLCSAVQVCRAWAGAASLPRLWTRASLLVNSHNMEQRLTSARYRRVTTLVVCADTGWRDSKNINRSVR